MKDYLKFLNKLPRNLALKVISAIQKIAINDLGSLDIKQLKGNKKFYRCRVGKVRIVFAKDNQGNQIYEVGFRGGIYNNLNWN